MIRFNNVSYQYQNTDEKSQLKDIQLVIPKGRFLLVTGKSGCGKSTLAQCMNGLIPYFHEGNMAGEVWIEKERTEELTIEKIGERVGSVFQNPRTQFFTTSTIDELAFGCQNMALPRQEILKRIDETIHSFKIEDLKEKSLFELSSGQKQKVAIASCYSMSPEIYVMDEPSANLDPRAIQELVEILGAIKRQGKTIIIMEHRLYYLKELIDEVIYMNDGKIIKHFTKEETLALPKKKLEAMGLRAFDLDQIEKKDIEEIQEEKNRLSVRDLGFRYKQGMRRRQGLLPSKDRQHNEMGRQLLRNINLEAKSGDVIGVIGKNGAGKTTFAKLLAGLLRQQEGTISINGKVLDEKQRIKQTYFVLQDSDYQLFTESVEKELTLGNEEQTDIKERGKALLEKLGLGEYMEVHPAALSRGQKQRLTIASGLLSKAPILILDEPTSGLDGASMHEVIHLLQEIRRTGRIIFVISHDYEFLVEGCNRILEVKEGTVGGLFKLSKETVPRLKRCLFGKEET